MNNSPNNSFYSNSPQHLLGQPQQFYPTAERIERNATGRIIRLRTNLYVFICDYCYQEIPLFDDFILHCEQHFGNSLLPYTPNHLPQLPQQTPNGGPMPLVSCQTQSTPRQLNHQNAHVDPRNQISQQQTNLMALPNPLSPAIYSPIGPSSCNSTVTGGSNDYTEEVYEIFEVDNANEIDNNDRQLAADTYGNYNPDTSTPKKRKRRGVDKYKCPQCPATYASVGNLSRHIKTNHADASVECSDAEKNYIEEEKKYKCMICEKVFWKRTCTEETVRKHVDKHVAANESNN